MTSRLTPPAPLSEVSRFEATWPMCLWRYETPCETMNDSSTFRVQVALLPLPDIGTLDELATELFAV